MLFAIVVVVVRVLIVVVLFFLVGKSRVLWIAFVRARKCVKMKNRKEESALTYTLTPAWRFYRLSCVLDLPYSRRGSVARCFLRDRCCRPRAFRRTLSSRDISRFLDCARSFGSRCEDEKQRDSLEAHIDTHAWRV